MLRAGRFETPEPLRPGVRCHAGPFAEDIPRRPARRCNHDSQDIADDLRKELRFPGIASSSAFVRAPGRSGGDERVISP